MAAAIRLSIPAPQPTSTTCSPASRGPAPKGLPAPVRDKLVAALNKALNDPALQKRFADLGSTAPQGTDQGPVALQKLVEADMARLSPVLKAAAAAGAQ